MEIVEKAGAFIKKHPVITGIVFFLFLIQLPALLVTDEQVAAQQKEAAARLHAEVAKTLNQEPVVEVSPIVFDVESLLNKTTVELVDILGAPTNGFKANAQQMALDISSNDMWEKDGYELMSDYHDENVVSGYFFVRPLNGTAKMDNLLEITGLSLKSNTYTVVEQPVLTGLGITGIHVCGNSSTVDSCR